MRNIVIAVVLVLAFAIPASAAIDQVLATNANVFAGSVGNAQSSVSAMINKCQQASTNSQYGQQDYQELINAGVISGRGGNALADVLSANLQAQGIGSHTINQTAATSTSVGTQATNNGSASVCVGKAGTQLGSTPGALSADSTMVMVFSQAMASPLGGGCQQQPSPASAMVCTDITTLENAGVIGNVCHTTPCNPCDPCQR